MKEFLASAILYGSTLLSATTSFICGSLVNFSGYLGVKQEKTIEINVDLPAHVNHSVKVSSYINGVLNKTDEVVPSYGTAYVISLKGNTGKKTVNVDIDGKQYRVYEVDFDLSSNNVSRVSAFDFKESTTREENNGTAQPSSQYGGDNEDDIYTASTPVSAKPR